MNRRTKAAAVDLLVGDERLGLGLLEVGSFRFCMMRATVEGG